MTAMRRSVKLCQIIPREIYFMRHERRFNKLKYKDEPLFDNEGNYRATCHDLKTDIMILLDQAYVGTLKDDDDGFLICFDNGQRFRVSIEELDEE